MEMMLQQKGKIQALETECNMLLRLVIDQNRTSQSAASNLGMSMGSAPRELKEEETVKCMKKWTWKYRNHIHLILVRMKPTVTMFSIKHSFSLCFAKYNWFLKSFSGFTRTEVFGYTLQRIILFCVTISKYFHQLLNYRPCDKLIFCIAMPTNAAAALF